MGKDPIVEEVRNAGKKLAEKSNNNLHELCEVLRKKENEHPARLTGKKKSASTGTAR